MKKVLKTLFISGAFFVAGFLSSSYLLTKKYEAERYKEFISNHESGLFDNLMAADFIYKLGALVESKDFEKFRWMSCVSLSLYLRSIRKYDFGEKISEIHKNEIKEKLERADAFIQKEKLNNNCDIKKYSPT